MHEEGFSLALDVDGVLLECYPPINSRIIKKFNLSEDFRVEDVVKNWDLTELPPEIRNFVFQCMADANVVAEYQFREGSLMFIKELYDYITNNGGKFIFNTHCFNDEVAAVRRKQLEDVSALLGIHPTYNISVGPNKTNAVTDIIIDDYIGNLNVSPAKTKVLYAMFHNQTIAPPNIFKSDDYNAIIDFIKEDLSNEKRSTQSAEESNLSN